MIGADQIPEVVWRVAMMTYHREIRRNPQQAWQLAVAAALTTWPHVALSTHVEEGRRIILPLTQEVRETDWGKPQGKEEW